jgi:hypothetical protein
VTDIVVAPAGGQLRQLDDIHRDPPRFIPLQ